MGTKDGNTERELNLKELLFRVLYAWRKVIIFGLLFAVLLGGYRFVTSFREMNNPSVQLSQENAYQAALSTYENDKKILNKEIENLNTSMERQQKYNDESYLMTINPFDKYVATSSYYIDSDFKIIPGYDYQNIDITNYVIRSYIALCQNGELYNYIMDNISYEIKIGYLKELIYIWPEYDTDMIFVQVIHNNEASCKEIINLIRQFFELKRDELVESVGEHSMIIYDDTLTSIVDFTLEETQKNNLQKVVDYKNSLQEKQNTLNQLPIPTKASNTYPQIIRSSVKYAAIGFAFGLCIISLYIIIAYMFSDKLHNSKQLRHMYNLRILGHIKYPSSKRMFGFIDKWLYRIDDQNRTNPNINEEISRITQSINIILKSENISNVKIMFSGSGNSEIIQYVSEGVKEVCDGITFEAYYSGNVCLQAQTVKQLSDCYAVVLVESLNHSSMSNIYNELETFKNLNKTVIGAILVS